MQAVQADLLAYLALLFTLLARRADKRKHPNAPHSWRKLQLLTRLGWVNVTLPYRPKHEYALCEALAIQGKTTPDAHALIARCGALSGSFKEAADTCERLAGVALSPYKQRAITLAAGANAYAASQHPAPGSDVRTYEKPPPGAVTKVKRTLVGMADGGSAPCCKADTQDVKGKDGEASTRQIRAGLFGEYEWLDADGRPLFYEDSFSYFVCGGDIADFTVQLKRNGLSRGSNTVARLHGLADGEPALEAAFRDAFPRAEFTNDFYHAAEHLHACLVALLPDAGARSTEFQLCRMLLKRNGAGTVAGRLRRVYASQLGACAEAVGHLDYLEKRAGNMRYGALRKRGMLIGTGHVEAAIRMLVVRRMKQAGMHWRHINAVYVAALHAQYRSTLAA